MKRFPVIPIGPSIAYIPLTQGHYSLVDVESLPLIDGYSWYVNGSNANGYYARGCSPTVSNVRMHRLIFGPNSDEIIDHANMNGLDNRRSNLRIATVAQNRANSKVRSRSGFKGVYPYRDKWQVILTVSGKKTNLGVFDDPRVASAVYERAAILHFGPFVRAK